MSGDVTMTCQLRVKPESLRIDYEIVNQSGRGIYAYVLPTDASMEPFHQQIYAALSANQRVLYLVVDKSPVPEEYARRTKKEAIPLACSIKAGGTYSDRFMAYFPIREWHAYATTIESRYGSSFEIEHAVLSIAYTFKDRLRRAERSTVPGFYEVRNAARKKLVTTLRLPEPIPVQARLDDGIRMTF